MRSVSLAAGSQRPIALQGKFGVDGDGSRGMGQLQQAVGLAIADLGLELIALGGQQVAHQIVQLDLAEGPARLLVGEDVLQPHHLARELHDIGLGPVDDGQARGELGQRLAGLLRGFLQLVADPLVEVAEPLLHRPGEVALLGLEPCVEGGLLGGMALGHLVQAPGDLGQAPPPPRPGARSSSRITSDDDRAQKQGKQQWNRVHRAASY